MMQSCDWPKSRCAIWRNVSHDSRPNVLLHAPAYGLPIGHLTFRQNLNWRQIPNKMAGNSFRQTLHVRVTSDTQKIQFYWSSWRCTLWLNVNSRISSGIGRHFKQSVDTLIDVRSQCQNYIYKSIMIQSQSSPSLAVLHPVQTFSDVNIRTRLLMFNRPIY